MKFISFIIHKFSLLKRRLTFELNKNLLIMKNGKNKKTNSISKLKFKKFEIAKITKL